MKHRIEDYALIVLKKSHADNGVYCSNGSLIGAMVQSGFDLFLEEYPNSKDLSLNCCFNYSKKSYNKLMKELKVPSIKTLEAMKEADNRIGRTISYEEFMKENKI